jgi:hypothetical protein
MFAAAAAAAAEVNKENTFAAAEKSVWSSQ